MSPIPAMRVSALAETASARVFISRRWEQPTSAQAATAACYWGPLKTPPPGGFDIILPSRTC
jgi:hypothetical protein